MPSKKKTPATEVVEPVAPPVPAPVADAPAAITPPQPLSPGDERTWALLAHLSVLLNLITGFAGPIAALVVYLAYKDRSRYIAYHALQAMVFQLIWWFGGGLLVGLVWAAVGILSIVLIGIVLIPVALVLTPLFLLMPLVSIVYGIVGAVKVSQGEDFKYWLVGDWVRGTLTG